MRILPLLALLLASAAWGQNTTYVYQGQNNVFTGFFSLPVPLGANQTLIIPSNDPSPETEFISSFQIGVNSGVFSTTDSTLSVTTDANGNIIAWKITGQLSQQPIMFTISNSGDVATTSYPYPGQIYAQGPPGHWIIVSQSVATALISLQKQLTMWQSASAWYEAHWLAWMAEAKKCQATGGRC